MNRRRGRTRIAAAVATVTTAASLALAAAAWGQATKPSAAATKPATVPAAAKPATPMKAAPATKPVAAPAPAAPAKSGGGEAGTVRPVPPPGRPIPAADRAALEQGVRDLGNAIDETRAALSGKPALLALLPDVQIYYNAVRYPLQYGDSIEVGAPKPEPGKPPKPVNVNAAKKALADGMERAKQLKSGSHPWTDVSGPRGYLSKIDGSVQPFLLGVPKAYQPGQKNPLPLALSCHGRGEDLTELAFINGKAGQNGNTGNSTVGDPETKFAIYLYGRYCCANKLAGEVDLFEAWDAVKEQYPIDPARVSLTGFSMGGGAVWHLAAHYGEKWCVASPGAGFAESERFLGLAKRGEVPPWYEAMLYKLYDATDHPENFVNCHTIAYAGSVDGQRQAGDVMEEALAKIGLKLERVVGPNVAHQYEKNAKADLDARVEALTKAGKELVPPKVRFATYSLRYDSMLWVTLTGLERHWKKATVDAEIAGPAGVKVTTDNVASLYLEFPAKGGPLEPDRAVTVVIDGQRVAFDKDANLVGMFALRKTDGKWAPESAAAGLRKRHGLQGPIDDAFMDSFLVVKPSSAAAGMYEPTAAWAAGECEYAVDAWRKQFRGEARVREAADVSAEDIATKNLVLFGDPRTNPLIARVLPRLPIEWTKDKLVVNGKSFAPNQHVPVMIYPNPLNPQKYVVLNSGFTFREADYLNNARQTPKLPDYAVVDVRTPPGPTGWGTLPKAGFFGERWEWQANDGKNEP